MIRWFYYYYYFELICTIKHLISSNSELKKHNIAAINFQFLCVDHCVSDDDEVHLFSMYKGQHVGNKQQKLHAVLFYGAAGLLWALQPVRVSKYKEQPQFCAVYAISITIQNWTACIVLSILLCNLLHNSTYGFPWYSLTPLNSFSLAVAWYLL